MSKKKRTSFFWLNKERTIVQIDCCGQQNSEPDFLSQIVIPPRKDFGTEIMNNKTNSKKKRM
jgi:hypothetical protein